MHKRNFQMEFSESVHLTFDSLWMSLKSITFYSTSSLFLNPCNSTNNFTIHNKKGISGIYFINNNIN